MTDGWLPGLVCDALRTILASEPSPDGDSTVTLSPLVPVDKPKKTEHSMTATYVTRVVANSGGSNSSGA